MKKCVGDGRDWDDNIKIDLREKECRNSVWIEVAQEYVRVTKIYKLILEKKDAKIVSGLKWPKNTYM